MKKLTRLLCALLSVLLALSCVTVVSFATAPTSYTDIAAGSSVSVSISSAGSAKYYRFTPSESGTYRFYSTDYTADPRAALLSADGTELINDDDNGADRNFDFSYDCVAGTTYYVKAYLFSSTTTGQYTLHILQDGVASVQPLEPTLVLATEAGNHTYSLFNSGRGTGAATYYSSTQGVDNNPDSYSYNNNGYDIYGSNNGSGYTLTIGMGMSFTIAQPVTEQGTLTVYAYDIDEERGQIDTVTLVDETNGSSREVVGTLSGMDSQWNTSTITLSPDLFELNHTYHFEDTISNGGWWTYIRTVDLELTTDGEPNVDPTVPGITDYDFTASISNTGLVTTNLSLTSNANLNFGLEYSATIDGTQRGSALNESVSVTSAGTDKQVSFQLESGAPEGTYEIAVILKDSSGSTVTTYRTTKGYNYSAVTYDPNGGSRNCPTDTTSYSDGDTVTVLFNYLPSRSGYTFLGWATTDTATVPEFTEDGAKTFVIGDSDVTLYAVWQDNTTLCHIASEWIYDVEPTCLTGGHRHTVCTICGETISDEDVAPLDHDLEVTASVDATCTVDGYVITECRRSGCDYEKRQNLIASGHSFGTDNICDVCGFERLVHQHDFEETVIEPTCTQIGYTVYACSCGYEYRDHIIEQSGHTWNGGVVTTEKTCTTPGVMTHSCTVCGESYTVEIEAGHDWSETIVVPATCTGLGCKERTCTLCGEVETIILPASHTWDEGSVILEPSCTTVGQKRCTCSVCGETQDFEIPVLGHHFVNGVCTRCGATIPEVVTPDTDHPEYGMYFEIDDIISKYGPSYINEYGVLLDYNDGAIIKKVAVYLTQEGNLWRRCIAVVGDNITYATYVPYLSYEEDIYYTGLNSDWINTFALSRNSDGIWCYSNYTTIGVNLEDYKGDLLLSLYDIGQAGAKTRIFDNLSEMIAWLKEDSDCIYHDMGDWVVDRAATCGASGLRHKECSACGERTEEIIPATGAHTESGWIVDSAPTASEPGREHKECLSCGTVLETKLVPMLATIKIADVTAEAGDTVTVTVDLRNNPGMLGAMLTFRFDSALTLISATAGDAWSLLTMTAPAAYGNGCTFIWDGMYTADVSNGTIITLTFAVSDTATAGSVLDISASYEDGNMLNTDLEAIDVVIEGGSVTVEAPVMGDVNGDGIVNDADVTALRRYLSSGYGVTINAELSDLDQNGEITVADVVLLRRLILNQSLVWAYNF